MKEIPLFYPYIPKKKILKEISDSLSGRWLGQGPKVKKFEEEFGKMMGYKYPLMLNSGTSALELAYHIIGLKKGDEVIVPILNCTAGQMGLLRRNVKIVFADIDENLNLSPEDLQKKITKKTKAIVAVHLGGIPFDEKIYNIAKKHNVPLIVDAAQHHVKSEGDFICYSFQAIKHITTCDGGMLILKDEKNYKRAKLLRWFGIDREKKEAKNYQAWERRAMTFDIEEAGYKYQPTDIDASFGMAALPDLPKIISYRKKLVEAYKKNLPKNIKIIAGGSYWLMGVLVENRDDLAEYLLKNGVDNNLVHLRNDIFKVFGGKRLNLPNMNRVESKYLYLPLNTKVTVKDVKKICTLIKKFYESDSKKFKSTGVGWIDEISKS
jgi:perosamine synthetase